MMSEAEKYIKLVELTRAGDYEAYGELYELTVMDV